LGGDEWKGAGTVESMRLDRFKNFLNAKLQVGPLTALVGKNASGGSNLRDALRFVHGIARGDTLAEMVGEKCVEGGRAVMEGSAPRLASMLR
jgi:chromosome segregation ATPase